MRKNHPSVVENVHLLLCQCKPPHHIGSLISMLLLLAVFRTRITMFVLMRKLIVYRFRWTIEVVRTLSWSFPFEWPIRSTENTRHWTRFSLYMWASKLLNARRMDVFVVTVVVGIMSHSLDISFCNVHCSYQSWLFVLLLMSVVRCPFLYHACM